MILIATPFHDRKRYAIEHILDWYRDSDLPDSEVIWRFHKGIYGEKDAVKKQREFFRKLALEGGYSHLLFVGADTIPPHDVLLKLLKHNVDVVGGVYYGRQNTENGLPDTAVVWKHNQPEFNKRENLEKMSGLVAVDGMGMDCVLFSRDALSKFSFIEHQQNDDDYPIYDVLKSKGITVWLDTDVVCKHYADEGRYS